MGEISLCDTCRHAVRIKSVSLHQLVSCHQAPPVQAQISFPVAECSCYDDRRRPSLQDMMMAAWIVESRNHLGFAEGKEELEVVITKPEQNPCLSRRFRG